jgi:hypothetical protein
MTASVAVSFAVPAGETYHTEKYSFPVKEVNFNFYYSLREEIKRVFKNVYKGADIFVANYSDNVPSIPFTILASER